jgi:ribonuclease P protein component
MQATRQQMKNTDRLKKRSDFLHAQGSGRKWVSKSLVLQICARGDGDAPRIGFTVSKKTAKSAVLRNRIRRRLRAAAADIMARHAAPGADYVLVGRADTATRSYDQIKKDLLWCLEKLGLKKP